MTFTAMHVVRSGSFSIAAEPARVLPCFTPEGERAWVPGWDPEVLHPRTGAAAAGAVFRTGRGAEETLWLWLVYDAANGITEYARITHGSRIGAVRVHVEPEGPVGSRVTVRYELTALSPAGNDVLAAFTEPAFAAMLVEWQGAVSTVVVTSPQCP